MSLRRALRRSSYFWLERRGWHLVRSGAQDPIPDTRTMSDLEDRVSDLPGIDMRESAQHRLLEELTPYREEIADLRIPPGFGAMDVEILYGMVRRFRPRLFIEIESGVSTRTTAQAMAENEKQGGAKGKIIAIDADAAHDLGNDARITIRREASTRVPVDFFQQLGRDDMLFIDTSHVLKTGSDVQYLLLDVLPQLPVGSLVHIHDIFFPREYPLRWFAELRFPSEQYVLQAFLTFNDSFEVVWSSAYMHHKYPRPVAGLVNSYDPKASRQGASFWMRRVS
jgi:hypothetical protein